MNDGRHDQGGYTFIDAVSTKAMLQVVVSLIPPLVQYFMASTTV